jgi:putative chitinase
MAFINDLYNLWPEGDKYILGLRDAMAASAVTVFPKYEFDSNLVVAHFMAQVSLECGAGLEVVENLNYSPQRLPAVWPEHFNSSNAYIYAHNPQKLANYIYEPPLHNDLGNLPNSNDGWNYRGRGATQTTGRDGYDTLGKAVELDLLTNPDLVNAPTNFLECGAADFVLCGCLPWAKADDIEQVTRHLNGGLIDLDQREEWLSKWKSVLGVDATS